MKFCTVDKKVYREFRGYVFFDGKPTNITDKATETLLLLNKDFKKVEDKPEEIVGTITLKNKGGRPRKVH